ncbi:MAG: hypothetical protein JSW73_02085 [Candidatus Woesearchaeota archaeon]|nr:MAG: hypothetical protein JSW73_02085 [Candidatus Woesearchaeota archaeon]
MVDEELFTYDDLYELLREELSSKELQPLEIKTLKKIKSYMNTKEELVKKAVTSKFSKETKRISEELENASQILIKINQKRTKKVIDSAIFTIRSESKAKDTSNMLPFEEELYNKLIKDLEKNETKFFSTIDEIKLIEKSKPIKKETKELKSKEKEETKTDSKLKEIRVLEDIPELTGPDLKNYGPYKKGDVAELPSELAVLIINKGKGREIK